MTQNLQKSATFMALAAPDEQFKVRLLIGQIQNPRPYTKNGRGNLVYQFDWDERLGLHVLDVPLSVWMSKFTPRGRDNQYSLPYELLSKPGTHLPIITIVEPVGVLPERSGAEVSGDKVALFTDLLTRIGAPVALIQAAERMATDSVEDFREFVGTVVVEEPAPKTRKGGRKSTRTPEEAEAINRKQAAARMAKKRERDAKNLEPAGV